MFLACVVGIDVTRITNGELRLEVTCARTTDVSVE